MFLKKSEFINKVDSIIKEKEKELELLKDVIKINSQSIHNNSIIIEVKFLKLSNIYANGVEAIFVSTIDNINYSIVVMLYTAQLTKIINLLSEGKNITIEVNEYGQLKNILC